MIERPLRSLGLILLLGLALAAQGCVSLCLFNCGDENEETDCRRCPCGTR